MSNKKNFGYAKKTSTSILYEKPNEDNPFVAESVYIHGYNLTELTSKKSFVEVLILLFTGELPNANAMALMNALMVGLINPGPRNPAVRAAMTAGISKSNTPHLLPIGLMVLGGEDGGATEVEKSMSFILEAFSNNNRFYSSFDFDKTDTSEGDFKIAPGFGSYFSQRCPVTHQIAEQLIAFPETKYLNWLHSQIIDSENNSAGWLPVGLAAATFLDLGIKPREGIGLYQLLCAPGIAAHALEQTHKPLSSMPFLEDSQYELKQKR
ncbi:citrate/2-methylcitrate synthase [Aliikangiella coralliicola]|uniref:Citrate synthase n=1 Tax=Aliikangiella coralliicola TaxID=2592383 RepID=A0A545U525_9GAMM|nr:citrate/2-methylcitrate synthase [Aliikangiella coralliicola]TQV84562.1 citrate synthase [Aliikangiella coralliicola]